MDKFDINSFSDYIELLKDFNERKNEELWYRGQSDNSWKLEPNLYRKKRLDVEKGELSILKYKLPNFKQAFEAFVSRIAEERVFENYNLNKFHLMFIGQHYGLPTPVLDWTTDPLAAMFFALEEFEYKDEEHYPVIYILEPSRCNRNSGYRWSDGTDIREVICVDEQNRNDFFDNLIKELMFSSSHVPIALCSKNEYSFRISRQSGNFTFINPVQPLNYLWNDIIIEGKPLAEKISINPYAVDEIRLCLKLFNINRNTLYKNDHDELDMICEKIKKESQDEFEQDLKRR